jgi:hypothetical protein
MASVPGGPPWRIEADGVVLAARVTPRADRDALEGVGTLADGRRVLLARVRAVAEGGKANAAALKLLARALGRPVSTVALLGGATARLKTFRIAGEPGAIAAALEGLAAGPGVVP